jgi:hypothetical protein
MDEPGSPEISVDQRTAAIVCAHVANQCCPILSAFLTTPDFPEDSGWQFFCGKADKEDPAEARIWALGGMLHYEPLLKEFMNHEPGIQLWREHSSESWKMRQLAD